MTNCVTQLMYDLVIVTNLVRSKIMQAANDFVKNNTTKVFQMLLAQVNVKIKSL